MRKLESGWYELLSAAFRCSTSLARRMARILARRTIHLVVSHELRVFLAILSQRGPTGSLQLKIPTRFPVTTLHSERGCCSYTSLSVSARLGIVCAHHRPWRIFGHPPVLLKKPLLPAVGELLGKKAGQVVALLVAATERRSRSSVIVPEFGLLIDLGGLPASSCAPYREGN